MKKKGSTALFLSMAAAILCCGIWQTNLAVTTVGGEGEAGIPVPVAMYHHVLQEGNKLLGAYAITPQELEQDLMWVRDNGYTPVLPAELLDYVENGGTLPAKPILLSFDDGYESFYVYAYPLLQKYHMKAVLSVLGYYTDLFTDSREKHINYSHVTWEQLREMQDSGLVEIGNHTYNLHKNNGGRKGSAKLPSESPEAYRAILTDDVMTLQDKASEHLGKAPRLFAYPFGAVGEGEPQIIGDMGFAITLSCREGLSRVRAGDKESLLMLRRYNREHKMNTEKYYAKVTGG